MSYTQSTYSLGDYTNTFVLSPSPNSEQTLLEIPKSWNFDPARRRRAHQKSRGGCENCRKRRVKCSQGVPCTHCVRRGEQCKPSTRSNRAPILTSVPRPVPAPILLPSTASKNAAVNLEHLKLFHHFQTSTSQTVLFGHDIWAQIFQQCFHFDFLMHAVFCIAARHLAFLRPEDPTYPTSATSHLCRALSRFRKAISRDLASTHVDAFIATSLLLQYEVWTSADLPTSVNDANSTSSNELPKDYLFTYCASLKQVFLKSISAKSSQDSAILPLLQHNKTKDALVQAAQISCDTIDQCQRFFCCDRPISQDLLDLSFPYKRSQDSIISKVWEANAPPHPTDANDVGKSAYMHVITHLCLILSFLPQLGPPEVIDVGSDLFPALSKFILSFPIICHDQYMSMTQERDPHILLILYHFYRAVRILMPLDKGWWAHQRAEASERVLKEWLIKESLKQGSSDNLTVH